MATLNKAEIEHIRTELLKNVGKNIQQIREDKGVSQFDLTVRMMGDFDVSNVSRIESGRNNPTLFTLFRLAEALEVTLPQLLDYTSPKE